MLKWFNKKKKDNKGFTLVELIIVIAILAILVGLLAPQYTKYVEKSRKSADISNLDNIVEGFKVAAADHEYDLIGANSTASVTYHINITAANTQIFKDNNQTNITSNDSITQALIEFTGYDFSKEDGQKSVKLKSKRWGTAVYTGDTKAGSSAIGAKITVDGNSDAVTVTYSNNVKEYSEKGTVTVTAVSP